MKRWKDRKRVQGAGWRRLDNTGKLFAMVTGEDLSNVFRVSAVLAEEVDGARLQEALKQTLPEFQVFQVKLRRGFFWNYFETNTREPEVELETPYPCRFIEPHSSQMYLFRVSFFKKRINFEVFHGLTDGMGAMNFLKRLVEHYLILGETAGPEKEKAGSQEEKDRQETFQREAGYSDDGYLFHYDQGRKGTNTGYEKQRAFQLKGKNLPFGETAVFHGYLDLKKFKALCREKKVSMTKYLAALLLWSLIQVYLDGETKKEPVAVNLPINLRAFFKSETMANFFAVTNISFPAHRRPASFDEVLSEVSRQMDEKIVRERLEETIASNVSQEKKWYVRITPLALKHLITGILFAKNTKGYTLTLSNLGPVAVEEPFQEKIEDFHVMIGVSPRQPLKCGVMAFGDTVDLTIASVKADRRFADYVYGWLEQEGILTGREENGAFASEFDRGSYPEMTEEKNRIRKAAPWFYGALLAAAVITGIVNAATYRWLGKWWSVLSIAGIAYAAMTVRFSILRHSSLAGRLVRQSLGACVLLVLIDWFCGYGGWAFNYAIPCVLLFNVVAVGGLIALNRLNWQVHFMYQIVITLFTMIPLALWWAGLVTKPFLSLFTAGTAFLLLAVTGAVGSRSVKRELGRRFHI